MTETKKRILLVDDDPDITAMLKLMLQVNGYEVRIASNPAQGMIALQSDVIDAMVVDVMMPNHSGLELCRYVRREPSFAKLPIVIYSALGDTESVRAGLDAGADTYIEKTASKDQILKAISAALANSRS